MFDVQDIVIDCAMMSLDLVEGSHDESQCPVAGALKGKLTTKCPKTSKSLHLLTLKFDSMEYHFLDCVIYMSSGMLFLEVDEAQQVIQVKASFKAKCEAEMIEAAARFASSSFSPSREVGLNTPPPEDQTPAKPGVR